MPNPLVSAKSGLVVESYKLHKTARNVKQTSTTAAYIMIRNSTYTPRLGR